MAGLGAYTLSPQIDGGVFAYHENKELRKTFGSEADFRHALQKNDWQCFFMAVCDALAAANKLQLLCYYVKNPGNRHRILKDITEMYRTVQKDSPLKQYESVRFMLDTFPLMAQTANAKLNKVIIDNTTVIQDYFDRYLSKYEPLKDPYLNA